MVRQLRAVSSLALILVFWSSTVAQAPAARDKHVKRTREKIEKLLANGYPAVVELATGSKLRGIVIKTEPESFVFQMSVGTQQIDYVEVQKVREIRPRGSKRALIAIAVGGGIVVLAIVFGRGY